MSLLNPSRTGTDWAKLYVIVFSFFAAFIVGILTFSIPNIIFQHVFLILLVLECSVLGMVILETKKWLLIGVLYTGITAVAYPFIVIYVIFADYLHGFEYFVGAYPTLGGLLLFLRFISVFVVYRWTEASGKWQEETKKAEILEAKI